ncbi:HD domain-containing protein [Paenibacillus lactis]|uniref:HD domain-containing protein n=1 Tax=Paenibacillus lactis TaxID=228574 RepID=UPI003D7640F9
MSMLEKAIQIAVNAHSGQTDKGGSPYILHPLRVMHMMESEDEKIVAVLHDVIEDTDVTYGDLLKEGFSHEVIKAVRALTRQENETYMEFIHRCKKNDLACKVKIQDIYDNLDLSRIENPTDEDYIRQKRYTKALRLLLA